MQLGKQGGKMMHADLIKATREEILRLIKNQNALLDELLKMPDLLKESSEDGQKRTDTHTVKEWKKIINDEKQKVNEQEMVLAVIGTMKAGKSTTINAIVGSEILPNRNHPMTSLPTLIRHKIGKKEPVLYFPKYQPIEEMVHEIKEKLSSLKKSNQLESVELYKDEDGKKLIQSIIDGSFNQFQDRYERQENIFNFLKFLNDLIRLAIDSRIDVKIPIEKYENIYDLPIIEVEFFHLANVTLTTGKFAVLDTPGPNELKLGEKLRKVLRTQIARASAVLAVVDYGQLRSEAEGEIREELVSQIERTGDRLFILVNQYDRKDRNGMTFEEVKRYAADNFLQGLIKQDRVYPVSALYAYLSNRALNEIKEKRCLPDYRNKENLWVEDFAPLAFGVVWEDDIQDIEKVRKNAKTLFDRSNFDQPINEVILKAASTAALISMQSATDKLFTHGKELENFLELRRGALTKSVEEIAQLINGFTQDIQEIENAEAKADQALKQLINKFLEAAQQEYETMKQELKQALQGYFKEGKKQEKQELEQKEQKILAQETKKERIQELLDGYWFTSLDKKLRLIERMKTMQSDNVQQYFQFDPNNPQIKFDSQIKAENLLVQVNQTISSIIDDSMKQLESALKILSNSLEQTVPQIIKDGVGEILENAKKRLKHQGFSLDFNVPELDIQGNEIDFDELLLSSIENSSKTISKTGTRKVKGFWRGRTSRFFGSLFSQYDWGYESYEYQQDVSYYVVDLAGIGKKVLTSLDSSIQELSTNNQILLNKKLKPLLDDYFNDLKDYLEKFRGDLKDSINDHTLSVKEKKELKQQISEFKERAELHRQDVQSIKQNLK
jgi:GTPase SAR1 family protein